MLKTKLDESFEKELAKFSKDARMQLAFFIKLLEDVRPQLKRTYADTLNGSKHKNMKVQYRQWCLAHCL